MSTTVLFHQLWVNPKAQELSRGGRPEDVRDDDIQEEVREITGAWALVALVAAGVVGISHAGSLARLRPSPLTVRRLS